MIARRLSNAPLEPPWRLHLLPVKSQRLLPYKQAKCYAGLGGVKDGQAALTNGGILCLVWNRSNLATRPR